MGRTGATHHQVASFAPLPVSMSSVWLFLFLNTRRSMTLTLFAGTWRGCPQNPQGWQLTIPSCFRLAEHPSESKHCTIWDTALLSDKPRGQETGAACRDCGARGLRPRIAPLEGGGEGGAAPDTGRSLSSPSWPGAQGSASPLLSSRSAGVSCGRANPPSHRTGRFLLASPVLIHRPPDSAQPGPPGSGGPPAA